MPIVKHFDRSKQLVTFTCEGELTFDEMISAIEAMYASEDIKNIQNTIWDMRNATASLVTSDQIRAIANFVREHKAVRRKGKSALVVSNDADFGLARMFELQVIDVPAEYAVFRTMKDALRWLTKPGCGSVLSVGLTTL